MANRKSPSGPAIKVLARSLLPCNGEICQQERNRIFEKMNVSSEGFSLFNLNYILSKFS